MEHIGDINCIISFYQSAKSHVLDPTKVPVMEKTPESVAQEIAAIRQSLKEVSAAVDRYAEIATKNVSQAGTTAAGEVSESHTALFMESHKFIRTARGPLDMVFSHTENVSNLNISCAVK